MNILIFSGGEIVATLFVFLRREEKLSNKQSNLRGEEDSRESLKQSFGASLNKPLSVTFRDTKMQMSK